MAAIEDGCYQRKASIAATAAIDDGCYLRMAAIEDGCYLGGLL